MRNFSYTTSTPWLFLLANRTLFLFKAHTAKMFATTSDFPVPGGPVITVSPCDKLARRALCWSSFRAENLDFVSKKILLGVLPSKTKSSAVTSMPSMNFGYFKKVLMSALSMALNADLPRNKIKFPLIRIVTLQTQ